ncbi:MAG: M23 family metallopeptidase [Saprospiraceae bacterium]|nr:M23 family metallopeptidase [Lewinellaceae bacterium]
MWNMPLRTLLGLIGLLPAFSFGHPDKAAVIVPDEPFPKDYFRMPVSTAAIRLSGTFGELRANHFHTGIDISHVSGQAGQAIFAAADGFIDRVKVGGSGYGKALYIKHPNGYTTVYGHLDKFTPAIEKYVKETQYKRERFEVDLFPKDGLYPVKKGQEIGRMGNTGSSGGPHLHFEVRRSANQKPLNPLLFGLNIPDAVPPLLRDMRVYFLNPNREVQSSLPFPIEQRPDGTYGVPGDTVRLPAWRVGFGLRSYDQSTGNTHNKNGLFALSLLTNDDVAYAWKADEFDFDETRYLNAHTDYAAYETNGAMYQRCFALPGDRHSNFTRTENLGAVPLYKEIPTKITVKAADANGNQSTVVFWAYRGEPEPQPQHPDCIELPFDVENHIDMEGFSMTIPKGGLYETLYFQYSSTPRQPGTYSTLHQAHLKTTPLHKYCTLRLRPEGLPENLREKSVIARYRTRSRPINCGGNWDGDWLVTRVRDFDDYCIMVDTTAPTIKPVVFSVDMRRKKTMAFRIHDDFITDARAESLRYRGTVDGKWVLFEFDRKRARLTHVFDGHIQPGEHKLRLVVTDDRGNEAVYERNFVR